MPRLALGHPHVFHHLLKLAQRLLGLSHAALLHELLNTIHHILQVLLGELHAFALLSLFTILLLLLLLLLGELLHVFVCRFAQLLHQLCDFFLRGPVAQRFSKLILCFTHPLKCIREIAVFQIERQIPKCPRQLRNRLIIQSAICDFGLHPPQNRAQTQIIGLTFEKSIRLMGNRSQKLGNARRIFTVPEQITAQLNHGSRQRIEEFACREIDLDGITRAHLARLVQSR